MRARRRRPPGETPAEAPGPPALTTALVALRGGDLVEAERQATGDLVVAQKRGDVVVVAQAALLLSLLALLGDRLEDAVARSDLALAQPIRGVVRNHALVGRARVAERVDDWDTIRALLAELRTNLEHEDALQRTVDDQIHASALRLRARLLVRDGDLAGARAVIDDATRRAPGDVDVVITQATVLALQGEVVRAEAELRRCSDRAEATLHQRLGARAALASLHVAEGELDRAADDLAGIEAEIASAGGDPGTEVTLLLLRASLRTERGDRGPETAALIETVLAEPRLTTAGRATAWALRAEVRLVTGDLAGAAADVDAALSLIERIGDRAAMAEGFALRARIAVAQGRHQPAADDVRRALAALGGLHAPVVAGRVAEARAAVTAARSD